MAGRPPFAPSDRERRMVAVMKGYGATNDDIADAMGIDRNTVAKHFPDELAIGRERATAEVALTLYEKAICPDPTGPSVQAATFWLRTAGRWKIAKEPDVVAQVGLDGQTLIQQNNQVNIDLGGMSDEELRGVTALVARLEAAGREGGD